MSSLDVTVAVINYNTKELLRKCLESIRKCQPLCNCETKVVDNGSSDGSVEMLKSQFPEVDVIENAGNLGYAAAANQALRQSQAKYVFILNSDTELDSEAIDILLEFAEDNPKSAVIGPQVLNPDGSVQASRRRFPPLLVGFMHMLLSPFLPNNKYTRYYQMSDINNQENCVVDWVSGSAMFIRRKAAEKIGFFDEQNFFMYVEDLDLCYRLRQNGWQVYYCPKAKVVHYIGQTSYQLPTKMLLEHHLSAYRFQKKTYFKGWKRIFLPLAAFMLVLRLILVFAVKLVQNLIARINSYRNQG